MEIDKENFIDLSKDLDVFEYNYEGQILTNNPKFDTKNEK